MLWNHDFGRPIPLYLTFQFLSNIWRTFKYLFLLKYPKLIFNTTYLNQYVLKFHQLMNIFCYLYVIIIQIEIFLFNQHIYIFLKQSNAISIKQCLTDELVTPYLRYWLEFYIARLSLIFKISAVEIQQTISSYYSQQHLFLILWSYIHKRLMVGRE